MIGQILKQARQCQKMTLKQIADQLNVSRQYISGIESGKDSVSIEQLKRICEAMNCELKIKIVKR